MNRPARDVCRFSTKAARRRRLFYFAIVFIAVAILAAGSALILAVDESAPPPSYGFELPQSSATPTFFNPFAKTGDRVSSVVAYFSLSARYIPHKQANPSLVQDYVDLKKGELKPPRMFKEPEETAAQKDRERYILARSLDVKSGRELAQIKGPSSNLYGGAHDGMCQLAGSSNLIALLRRAVVSIYKMEDGIFLYDINLRYPFSEHPETGWGYEKMTCNTSKPEVALLGGSMMKSAHLFGFSEDSGATPIVVIDVERKAIKKVLFSATPLNGVAYTSDGRKLVSFGMSPTRVWDANKEFAPAGEIANPPKLDWVAKQFLPVDVLNPPEDAPRGNAGDLAPIPGSDLMIGLASALHLWDTTKLRVVATAPASREALRIAVHAPENTLAPAELNRIHLYRFNADALPRATKGE